MAKNHLMYYMEDDEGNKKNLKDVSVLVKCTYAQAYHAYVNKKIKTISELIKYREILKNGGRFVQMKRKLYKTKYGMLSTRQIYDMHPHKDVVTFASISSRITRRGGMCPSLWWPSLDPGTFRAKLVEEGIIPPYTEKAKKRMVDHKPVFNRSVTCYRHKHTERCKHYYDLSETFISGDRPDICKSAKDDCCDNYDGELIDAFIKDKHGASTARHSCESERGTFYLRV